MALSKAAPMRIADTEKICISFLQRCPNSIFRFMLNWLSHSYSERQSLSGSNNSLNKHYGLPPEADPPTP